MLDLSEGDLLALRLFSFAFLAGRRWKCALVNLTLKERFALAELSSREPSGLTVNSCPLWLSEGCCWLGIESRPSY